MTVTDTASAPSRQAGQAILEASGVTMPIPGPRSI